MHPTLAQPRRSRLKARWASVVGVYRNIVVAYDGSEGARSALERAAGLAGPAGATLHLVHATGHVDSAEGGVVEEDPSAESSARADLERVAGGLDSSPVATSVVTGDPVQGIISAAEGIHADLIVTGSRGRAMMPQAVLGRVTSGLVSNAPCDVLVVQPKP